MAPKAKAVSQTNLSKKAKVSTTRPKTVALGRKEPSSTGSNKSRKFDPLTASHLTYSIDDSLWVDRYEPSSEAELAVHVKKVENVRQWLQEAFEGGLSGTLKKYRRILTLTGPSGTGKTSTLRVLANEMGFEILEWKDISTEGLFTRFEAFLTRSSTCNNLFSSSATSSKASSSQKSSRRRLILLEDLPNILHQKTKERFHEALTSFVSTPHSEPPVPLVIIVSDAGLRGEDRDARMSEGRFGRDKNQIIDIRTVIPKELLSSAYVTEIRYSRLSKSLAVTHIPSKEVLDAIVDSSNGDIRSAIMALQFACIVEMPGRKKKNQATKMVMEAVTRREQTLAMFHLLGKVLYNKRKGDPPNASTSAKDLQKERDVDTLLKDPNKLPAHLDHQERRTSRVDVDKLYSDSPIDSSLFSLYIHQNYSQFCDHVDHCYDLSDWLSYVDSSGGEAWYQANPHQFHLLALGTLHSLPSPVQRRSQKYYKPQFFSSLQKERDGLEGVRRTKDWLAESARTMDDSGWRAGGWSQSDIILELGAVLKAHDAQSSGPSTMKPPPMHRMFSKMEFVHGGATTRLQPLDENDMPEPSQGQGEEGEFEGPTPQRKLEPDQHMGGWLESDDIQDFE
ncbi:Rad17 cell cycle checkpoint protein-domain-containing protein [Crepidotus variabilis]|uniref:Rad17 cell cycle checkpoint protein-domain-containing protein n=1 Tax=Crepidotus variabilis TaxID=179855 RepID=A0A9P6ELZ4_9AGAR|nr:Rad17 cell cycle checkpoint protein-domain-containing protein [Crepidotus variabilis]